MPGDYTRQVTLGTAAVELIEFSVTDMDNVTIIADADWLLFLNGASGSGFKVLANSAVEIDLMHFNPKSIAEGRHLRVLGKVAAGSTTAYVSYMGSA